MPEQDLPVSASDTIRAGAPPQYPGAPTDAFRAGPPPETTTPGRPKSATRFVVPLVLLLAIIGGIAWVVQNMPSWRGKTAPPKNVNVEALLRITHLNKEGTYYGVWEREPGAKQTMPYSREFERGADGRYYFHCENALDEPVELSLTFKSCDCAQLFGAVVSNEEGNTLGRALVEKPGEEITENPAWSWHDFGKVGGPSMTLPPRSHALLRFSWHNRRGPGESLNLKVHIAAQTPWKRQEYGLIVLAASAAPVRVQQDRVNVGNIAPDGKGKAEFDLWSPTRDQLELALYETGKDPLFTVDAKPLDQAGRAALQEKLAGDNITTRVRAGWHVTVWIDEKRDGRQMPLGHFFRTIEVKPAGVADEIPPLRITGYVKGDVDVGGVDDLGKIDLKSFKATLGREKNIYVWANRDTELELEAVNPAAIQVKLSKSKDPPGAKQKWILNVVVPPNQVFGVLGEDNDVILRTKSNPPRQIRIPLIGHAVQG